MLFDDASRRTDDDYESEEDMPHHQYRPTSPPNFQLRPVSNHGPSSHGARVLAHSMSRLVTDAPENTIDKLRIEMATLRKQANDALSMSISATDQLSQAHAECSRAKAQLKLAESMLEDEARKRREAERIADEEIRRRRVLEAEIDRYRHHLKSPDVESEDED